MVRLVAWMMVPALGTIAALIPPADEPVKTFGGWGQPVDPAGDCRIGLKDERLTIDVPGTKHDLSAEAGDMNAPRVLRPIRGDFIAQMRVSGNLVNNANGVTTSGRYLPYHGAGFLIWLDDKTYLRFERAVVFRRNGEVIHYANFALRKDGKIPAGHDLRFPDGDTYLRIERRGGRIFAMVSPDGISWSSLPPIAVDLPEEVKLGAVAVNTSTDPFQVDFSDLEIFKIEKKAAPK